MNLHVDQIFELSDGRTVLVGATDDDSYWVGTRSCEMFLNGKLVESLEVVRELPRPALRPPRIAVSTSKPLALTRELIDQQEVVLCTSGSPDQQNVEER